jgi:hypothetical protein
MPLVFLQREHVAISTFSAAASVSDAPEPRKHLRRHETNEPQPTWKGCLLVFKSPQRSENGSVTQS